MKQLYWIVIILILIALPFLFSLFLENYTATAVGVVLIGGAINIIMFDLKATSRAMLYMWIAIIFVIAALLGIQGLLPNINVQ